MTKKEMAKKLRRLLTGAIRALPDDFEYKAVSLHRDFTSEAERNREEGEEPGKLGSLHLLGFVVEEVPWEGA